MRNISMIKVTFKKDNEEVTTEFKTETIINTEQEIILMKDVVSVEKQVKNLTLEEMEKLGYGTLSNETKDGVALCGIISKDGKTDYDLDDYVDITELIKVGV